MLIPVVTDFCLPSNAYIILLLYLTMFYYIVFFMSFVLKFVLTQFAMKLYHVFLICFFGMWVDVDDVMC